MSEPTGKDLFDKYARDCVKLAEHPAAPPELREQLFQMAREWMQAAMEVEGEAVSSLDRASSSQLSQ
jgi:hypothetical protein